jgi:hypothetical protein
MYAGSFVSQQRITLTRPTVTRKNLAEKPPLGRNYVVEDRRLVL